MRDLEAARSFDFEDDEIFCPFNLLTEDDVSADHPPVLPILSSYHRNITNNDADFVC